ncbi:DNA-binding transcriptional LysR family regulator [Aestuariispira insulae]|uniref:DNA-binding transcriptional LysR family regulator n=2 Tax=Aestuariispira insulae TaxID=1461337 RepID=A0A3D9H434_9PROT|nr:DNA-binding transcriptional LysR family regulator [Aestuariispira insulae]
MAAVEGSFSGAARRLNITQGAVSQRIKTLEDRAGGPLFARNYHKLALTAAGQQLLPMARRILRMHDEARIALQPQSLKTARLGVAEDYAGARLAAVLNLQRESMPQLEFEVVCCKSVDLVDMVDAGKLDLAVITPPDGFKRGTLISRRQLIWTCSAGFEFQPGQPLPVALYPQGCVYRQNTLETLERRGMEWRIIMSSESGRGVLAAVEAGLALTVMAEGTVPPQLQKADAAWNLPTLGMTEIRLIRRPDAPDFVGEVETLLFNLYQTE